MNQGDFARLYDDQYPRVFRYLLWRFRDRDAAEELTAEVFAVALAALQKGTEPRHVGSWLVGIADHLASRMWRKKQTEALRPEASLLVGQDPEELVLRQMESKMVWRCMDELNPEHRQILLLRIVAGLSAREVGELLEKTEEAVRSLQLRALQALRAIWKETEAGAGRHHTRTQ